MHKYITVRFVTDWVRQIDVPIGVILWEDGGRQPLIRLPQSGEQLPDVNMAEARPHLQVFHDQIDGWLQSRALPYTDGELEPLSDEWWAHVQKLLSFSIRVSDPRPLDCVRPEIEVEALFSAAVQPRQPRQVLEKRLETLVREAIGQECNSELVSRTAVFGYHEKLVRVMKAKQSHSGLVVIDAVDLSGKDAVPYADELTSRLQRIKAGPPRDTLRFITGYLSSPGGLNGEVYMVDWIKDQVDEHVYDLIHEQDLFAGEARRALSAIRNERQTDMPL